MEILFVVYTLRVAFFLARRSGKNVIRTWFLICPVVAARWNRIWFATLEKKHTVNGRLRATWEITIRTTHGTTQEGDLTYIVESISRPVSK